MVFLGYTGFIRCCSEPIMNKCLVTHIVPVVLLFLSCSSKQQEDKIPQTATSGELHVAVDEGFWPIMQQEKAVFEYIYKYATLDYQRTSQEEAIRLLLLDSVRFAVTARELTENELSYLKSKKVFPKTYVFAKDGLLLLTNKNSKDTAYTLSQLKEIAVGNKDGCQLVFEKNRSASLYSFVRLLKLENAKLAGIYSLDSAESVVDYVSGHPNTIGVLGSSWFSEQESGRVQSWLAKVNIASVSANGREYWKPFQSEIADSLYPFARPIYLISRESQMSLADGYAAFLLGEKGQRIVLKSGLLPAKIPAREVVVSKKSF